MIAPNLQRRDELVLRALADDELITHLRAARDSGDLDGAKLALQLLVFGYMDHVRSRVALKVPSHAVDEVAGHALVSALTSAFRGQSTGEFRAWLHVIVDRRIADYHRAGRLELVPLVQEHDALPAHDDDTDAVAMRNVVDAAMADVNEVHRAVIDRYVFDGLPAGEVARSVTEDFPSPPHPSITAGNVHKIAQRFRDRVRAELEQRDTG